MLLKQLGKLSWFTGIAVVAVVASGSLIRKGWGDVLLEDEKVPVPDAWIIATRKECHGLAHCNTLCREVRVVRTDQQGRYAIRSRHRELDYQITAYREGYQPKISFPDGDLSMQRDGRDDDRYSDLEWVDKRIEYLANSVRLTYCYGAPQEQQTVLRLVHHAMLREAMSLAQSPEQQERARQFCKWMHDLHQWMPTASEQDALNAIEPACNSPVVVEEPLPIHINPAPREQRMFGPESQRATEPTPAD